MIPLSSHDPAVIANLARCFNNCVGGSSQSALRTYLLAQLGNISTPPCITPSAPVVFVAGFTNTTINLIWNLNGNPGSLVNSYTVFWGTTSGVYSNNSGPIPAGNPIFIHNYTISGLTPGTQYFAVVVSNTPIAGCNSANSNEVTATTGGASAPCNAGVAFASSWAAQVVANGGVVPSAATQTAIANFQCGLIADGLDTQMLLWNAIAPDNFIAATTPQLIVGGGNVLWTNHAFVPADLTVNGITGDGATKYFQTGWAIPGAQNASFGVARYEFASSASGASYGWDTPANGVIGGNNAGANVSDYNGAIAANQIITPTPGQGFFSGQRISTTNHKLYFANSTNPHAQVGPTDAAAFVGVLGGGEIFVMAYNQTGAPQAFSADTISFIAFTTGLSAADSAKLFARVQTLRKALLGGFV